MSNQHAASTSSAEALMNRIRAAALKEAARRDTNRSASPSTTPLSNVGPDLGTDILMQTLEDEQTRNNVEWDRIRADLVQLGRTEPAEADVVEGADINELALRTSETEVRLLDFEIKALTNELSRLSEPTSREAQALDYRAALVRGVSEYDDALQQLARDLELEQSGLEDDRKLVAALKDVDSGLKRRIETEAQRASELTLEEVAGLMKIKLRRVEADLSELLGSLIDTSRELFDVSRTKGDERRRGEKDPSSLLRSILDSLMNSAWDTPADPYIQVANRFPPAMLTFLVRANIALEHPSDARRLKLVTFQRPAGAIQ